MGEFYPFSITHKGAKHEADAPCQDTSAHQCFDNAAMAVVADGHGSARCFRSDIGSEKAVEIAKKAIASFINKTLDLPSEMTTQFIDRKEVAVSESKIALGNVVREIIDKWFAAVMKNEEENPLKEDVRLEGIVKKYKDRYITDVDYRCHAYGTTLIAVVMSENYWFGFQVGDGKCVVLYENGDWKLPIPWDDKCTFNTTTSICDDDSLSRFRYWFGLKNEKGSYTEYGYGVNGEGKDYKEENRPRPIAIFIGSDGVEDSYPRIENDKYVINFYRNRIVSFAENDSEAFKEEISGLAKRFADRESTDDVSIAGIIGDVSKADITKLKRESEIHETRELASVKRRDADEKKVAYETVQKRTSTVTVNQQQLESRITAVEVDVNDLNTQKASLDAALIKGKAAVEASDRKISELQRELRELESEIDKTAEERRLIEAKYKDAEMELMRAENSWEKCDKNLRKKEASYDKYLRKTQSVQRPGTQYPSIVVTKTDTSLTVTVNTITDELQNLRTQALVARRSMEAKGREISSLQQQWEGTQQLSRRSDFESKRITQELNAAEALNRTRREDVRKLTNNIDDVERKIETKQTEINKLKGEWKSLKEQTKKQTDTLSQIKTAWEQAEAEAQKWETAVQNNN